VTIRAGSSPGDVYIRFVRAGSSGRLQLSCYIREGGRITVRLPSGNYEMRIARGSNWAWQGEANAFGLLGSYSVANFRALGSNYTHTIDLLPVDDGNMPLSGMTLDAFLGR